MRQAIFLFWFFSLSLCAPARAVEEKDEKVPDFHERIEVIGKVELARSQQSVTLLDLGELRSFGFSDLKTVLHLVPGMLILSSGHAGQYSYSFARGAAVNQQLYLLDGVKLQDPSSSLGNSFSLLPSLCLEKVEVVRGPLSNRYGSSAMGGVINLVSRRENGVAATLLGGSHGTVQAGLHAGKSWRRVSLASSGSVLSYSDGETNDRYQNRGFVLAARYEGEGLRTGLTLVGDRVDCGIPLYMGSESPKRRYGQDDLLLILPFSWHAEGPSGVELQLSWQRHRYDFSDPLDAWTPNYGNRSQVLGIEARGFTAVTRLLRLNGGIDFSFRKVADLESPGRWSPWRREPLVSGFGSVDADLRSLLASISLRFDRVGDGIGVWSPQAGVSWNLARGLKLRGSFSRSFRAPSLPERLNPLWGNPDLRTERGLSFELGADAFSRSWLFGACWFSSRYEDLIGYSPLTWRFANINQARISGLEVNGRLTPAKWLLVLGSYTYLHTVDMQYDRSLLRRPKHQFSAAVQLRHRGCSLSADMVYVGKRLDYDEILWSVGEIRSFNVFNVAGRIPLPGRLALLGRLSNVADRRYAEVLGYPAPGRRLSVGIEYTSHP